MKDELFVGHIEGKFYPTVVTLVIPDHLYGEIFMVDLFPIKLPIRRALFTNVLAGHFYLRYLVPVEPSLIIYGDGIPLLKNRGVVASGGEQVAVDIGYGKEKYFVLFFDGITDIPGAKGNVGTAVIVEVDDLRLVMLHFPVLQVGI